MPRLVPRFICIALFVTCSIPFFCLPHVQVYAQQDAFTSDTLKYFSLYDLDAALDITKKIHEAVDSQSVIHDSQVALVCISSLDFDESQVIAGHMFKTLGDNNINIEGISTSVSSVTCMIHVDDLDQALTVLRQAFILP